MIFSVPDLTLSAILSFEKSLPDVINDNIFIFDFSKMTNFDPLPMLLAGSIIRRYRKKHPDVSFQIAGCGTSGTGYAGTMGFFKYISPSIEFGKGPGEATGSSNYIPITTIAVEELREDAYSNGNYLSVGDLLEIKAGHLAKIVDRGNLELHKLLTYLIREILRNTPEHAKSNKIWVCGQYWPSFELAEIAIMDEGIGIYNSITQNIAHKEYIRTNAAALRWSLKAGISESFRPSSKQKSNDEWANSGFGLYMVSQICKELNGWQFLFDQL